MNKRITKLEDSPCYKCGCQFECDKKVEKSYKFQEIQDYVFGREEYDYKECPLWIAINAPEMVEVEDG